MPIITEDGRLLPVNDEMQERQGRERAPEGNLLVPVQLMRKLFAAFHVAKERENKGKEEIRSHEDIDDICKVNLSLQSQLDGGG